jgi:hypothetical protein
MPGEPLPGRSFLVGESPLSTIPAWSVFRAPASRRRSVFGSVANAANAAIPLPSPHRVGWHDQCRFSMTKGSWAVFVRERFEMGTGECKWATGGGRRGLRKTWEQKLQTSPRSARGNTEFVKTLERGMAERVGEMTCSCGARKVTCGALIRAVGERQKANDRRQTTEGERAGRRRAMFRCSASR